MVFGSRDRVRGSHGLAFSVKAHQEEGEVVLKISLSLIACGNSSWSSPTTSHAIIIVFFFSVLVYNERQLVDKRDDSNLHDIPSS